jgi:hypothetical protein
MNRRFSTFTLLAALVLACTASIAFAQDGPVLKATPLFTAIRHNAPAVESSDVPAKHLVQWNGSFIDLHGAKRTFTMAGTDPSKTNVTTTFTVWVIPVKFVYDSSHGNKTFDPQHKLSNGRTVIQNTLKSPLFNAGIDFKQGATDLGNTQYIDAFQRGTWWGKNVKKNNKYHVLLKPVIKPEQTINCTDASCQVDTFNFGGPNITAGLADINFYDAQVQSFMTKLGATADILPLFIWYDVYLTQPPDGLPGCCIGGYHGTNGGPPNSQTYSNAAYADVKGIFSQDVSAMSHELGEWMDNPFFGTNTVGCMDNSQLEVGDPLEGQPNFGGFPYKLNGFTYNLQSLVWIGYFGAPTKDSANKWLSFQNDQTHVCPGQ